ncbi:MAG: hypothetical protein ACXACD_12345 [Candidatus Thorarchaeota archaeon]
MRLPGTNIEVLVSTSIIEIRDEDYLKSIEYSGKKYEDVLDEIQRIMHTRGWDITRRVIKFVLDRLGLPEVDHFPSGELTQEEGADLSEMLDSVRELTGLKTEAMQETSAESEGNLTFNFHAKNIPKEATSPRRDDESKDSSIDWEDAPSVGSSSDGVSS